MPHAPLKYLHVGVKVSRIFVYLILIVFWKFFIKINVHLIKMHDTGLISEYIFEYILIR